MRPAVLHQGLSPGAAAVAVLLRVYAKCIAGQEDSARERVDAALQTFAARSPQTPDL
jgi:hypothetical protein